MTKTKRHKYLLSKKNRNIRKTQNIRGKRKYKGGKWEGSLRQKLYRYLNPFYTSNANKLILDGNKIIENKSSDDDLNNIEQIIDGLAAILIKTDEQTKLTSSNNANACKYCIGKKLLDEFQDNRNNRNRIPDEPDNYNHWYKGCIICDSENRKNGPIIKLIQKLMERYNNNKIFTHVSN